MYQKFLSYLQETGMDALLRKKGAVLAAYSGGADSTLLLHWLRRYCLTQGISLYAAHLHHGIRGAEADRDLEHCRKTAEELSIPLHTAKADIPTLARERSMGLEECARAERYAFFDSVCRSLGMPDMPVATAHNGDDQTETVLFHMLRGSGLAGMTGISPIREGRYIRPLLPFSGETIRQICHTERFSYVEDSTNTDTAYTRNYIRHEILPKLRHLTPHPEEAVARMTELLTTDQDYLETEAARQYAGCRLEKGILARDALRQMHPAVSSRILRLAYEEWVPTGSMSKEQTRAVLQAVTGRDNTILRFSLPGGITAEIRPDRVCLTPGERKKKDEKIPESQFRQIRLPPIAQGESIVIEWGTDKILISRGSSATLPENFENIYNLSIQHTINFATIKGVLCLRTRKAGDTVMYHGMHRKLRRLQNEFHIPMEERETMPLLTDEEEILWAAGLEPCDKVRRTEGADDLLCICLARPAAGNGQDDKIMTDMGGSYGTEN